jgi:hypothetical protein
VTRRPRHPAIDVTPAPQLLGSRQRASVWITAVLLIGVARASTAPAAAAPERHFQHAHILTVSRQASRSGGTPVAGVDELRADHATQAVEVAAD